MEKGYERRGERRSFEARRRLPRRPTRGVEGEDRRAATRGRHERREQINTGENDSTKLSSILTVQNSNFHIETSKNSKNESCSKFNFLQLLFQEKLHLEIKSWFKI